MCEERERDLEGLWFCVSGVSTCVAKGAIRRNGASGRNNDGR